MYMNLGESFTGRLTEVFIGVAAKAAK